MAYIECASSQYGVSSVFVEVENITSSQVDFARARLDMFLTGQEQVSTAVAQAFLEVAETCPLANPSDLWHHVIYRHLLSSGWNDNKWKRVSGFALERALVAIYRPRLCPYGLRMRIVPARDANELLRSLNISETRATKVDLFLEGKVGGLWYVFGATHVKSSIAERIQDDVPASLAFINRGLLSIAITMDAKSYPPPHGIGVNYGELGGRSFDVFKERLKRNYIEVDGQFDGLFSFNLRTPSSQHNTPSGKRIHTMALHEEQPDQLVSFLLQRWSSHITNISI